MSYSGLLLEIDAALQAQGLTAAAELREDTLLTTSRGNFDGSYLLRSEQGAKPWLEASLSPTHWWAEMTLEVATEIKTSAQAAHEVVEERARKVFEALVYANFTAGHAWGWQPPQILRALKDKRVVWTLRFNLRWDT